MRNSQSRIPVAAPFHSVQTQPFEQLIVQLFSAANPGQQADLANRLLGDMPMSRLGALSTGTGACSGTLAELLLQLLTRHIGPMSLTPEQASTLTVEGVQQLAAHASAHSAGLVKRLSGFYAQHPGATTTVSSAALTLALAELAERHST